MNLARASPVRPLVKAYPWPLADVNRARHFFPPAPCCAVVLARRVSAICTLLFVIGRAAPLRTILILIRSFGSIGAFFLSRPQNVVLQRSRYTPDSWCVRGRVKPPRVLLFRSCSGHVLRSNSTILAPPFAPSRTSISRLAKSISTTPQFNTRSGRRGGGQVEFVPRLRLPSIVVLKPSEHSGVELWRHGNQVLSAMDEMDGRTCHTALRLCASARDHVSLLEGYLCLGERR